MRIFFTFLLLSIASLACTRFSNQYDGLTLDCGSDFNGSDPIVILNIDGARLSSSGVEAYALLPDGRESRAVSAKGCMERPSTPILVRHMYYNAGFVGEPEGRFIRLRQSGGRKITVSCPSEISVKDVLNLQDFLNLQREEQLEAYELDLRLSMETKLLLETGIQFRGQTPVSLSLPDHQPEGPAQLKLDFRDLIRREGISLVCRVNIDRTAPQPAVDVDAIAEHVRGPQLLTEVDDRRPLQLSTDQGQIFYCLHSAAEAPCEADTLYEKPANLASWPGEVVVRYRAVDAAGNVSDTMSRNLLVTNSFQENEVASLASSSRGVAGKSFQAMLDALRAEEKRRLLPSAIQRDRQSLSTYWALLKNYMAPQAPLLTVPYTESRTEAYWNDISRDGQWLCYADKYEDQVHLFHVADQKKITLPFAANGCRFSPDGSRMLAINQGAEDSVYLVHTATMEVQHLPDLPVQNVLQQIHLDAESRVFVIGGYHLFRWTPGDPKHWEILYQSDKELNGNFGERDLVLWFSGGMKVFDLENVRVKSEIAAENLSKDYDVGISPDGKILMAAPPRYPGGVIRIWFWNEGAQSFDRAADFEPHHSQDVLGIVINSDNDQVILEHANGTASFWRFSREKYVQNKGKFVLQNKAIGVPGDIIENYAPAYRPRARFLERGKVGVISSSNITILRGNAEGSVLASNLREFLVDDTGDTILAEDADGNVKVFLREGEEIEPVVTLHQFSRPEHYSRLFLNDSGRLLGVNDKGKLILWEREGSDFRSREHPASGILIDQAALSDDGRKLAVGAMPDHGSGLHVWYDGQLMRSRSDFCVSQGSMFPRTPRTLKFSPDGNRLLISCIYGEAQIWDLKEDVLTSIGPDIWIEYSLFHESGHKLIFDNRSVMETHNHALHYWNEEIGVKSYSFNADKILSLSGSRDFQLIASISDSDLIFWSPELHDRISVWEDRNHYQDSLIESLAVASTTLRTFVLKDNGDLIHWPLSAPDIYKNLCAELKPQIHALNLQDSVCQQEHP